MKTYLLFIVLVFSLCSVSEGKKQKAQKNPFSHLNKKIWEYKELMKHSGGATKEHCEEQMKAIEEEKLQAVNSAKAPIILKMEELLKELAKFKDSETPKPAIPDNPENDNKNIVPATDSEAVTDIENKAAPEEKPVETVDSPEEKKRNLEKQKLEKKIKKLNAKLKKIDKWANKIYVPPTQKSSKPTSKPSVTTTPVKKQTAVKYKNIKTKKKIAIKSKSKKKKQTANKKTTKSKKSSKKSSSKKKKTTEVSL